MTRLIALFSLLCAIHFAAANPPTPTTDAPERAPTKVATLNFGPSADDDAVPGIVGQGILAQDWREAAKKLEADKPDLVIVRINACDVLDGDPREAAKFHAVFRDMKKQARVVGWIESACFSGSLAVLPIEEYHMLPNGRFGAISMGEQDLKDSPNAAAWKKAAETAATDGKHPLPVIRAMQDQVPLSVSQNPTTGAVTFTQDEAGPIVLNRKQEILTLTADQAVKYGFAKSIAATEEQLLANMGYTKLRRVGETASKWLDDKMAERAKPEAPKDAERPVRDEPGTK